jgi:hypothetical protein
VEVQLGAGLHGTRWKESAIKSRETFCSNPMLFEPEHGGRPSKSPGFNPGLNGTKLGRIWEGFCPEGAIGLSPGFQPWEPSKQMVRPERARDAYTLDLRCGDV